MESSIKCSIWCRIKIASKYETSTGTLSLVASDKTNDLGDLGSMSLMENTN